MSKKLSLALLRLTMSFIFLWAFFDKLFGLGFATKPHESWLQGASPTTGYLQFGTKGPLHQIFNSLAEQQSIDWLFMMGLLFIGIALFLGIGMRVAAYSGSLLMFLIWLSLFPPENNPLIDEHIIYILVFIVLWTNHAGRTWGFGELWRKTKLVRNNKWLE